MHRPFATLRVTILNYDRNLRGTTQRLRLKKIRASCSSAGYIVSKHLCGGNGLYRRGQVSQSGIATGAAV